MSQPRDVAEVPGSATEVRWYGVVLLVGHLALTVIGAVSLWRIAGGWWVGAAAAALFVLGYLALWRYLLAPGSRQRLAYRERLAIGQHEIGLELRQHGAKAEQHIGGNVGQILQLSLPGEMK